MRLGLGVAAALMLMATGAMATAAWADDPMRLAVVSYGKIPAGSSFETELFQNTEISNHVASTLKDALTAHGFRYDPDGRGLVFAINADPTGRGESDQALGITDQSNGQVHITIDTNDTGQSTDTIARGYRITLGIYERAERAICLARRDQRSEARCRPHDGDQADGGEAGDGAGEIDQIHRIGQEPV